MTQPLKHDRYGRPITHYELPLLKPARERASRFMPELDANNRPCGACPKCNGGISLLRDPLVLHRLRAGE